MTQENKLRDKKFRILIVDDDSSVREVLSHRFERRGHEVQSASGGEEAIAQSKTFQPQVMLSDIRMPGMDGFGVLEALKIPTVLMTGHGDKECAIRAVEAGAFAFFEKPFDMDALEFSVLRAAERGVLESERNDLLLRLKRLCRLQNRELENRTQELKTVRLTGSCPQLVEISEILLRVSKKPKATLLIGGATGTGKEIVARELHYLTFQEQQEHVPFLAINCAAIPKDLLESELFGHEKGTFTGATQARIGLAEAVRHGTLFLDEIGEMDISLQAKILRLLEAKSFRKLGSNKDIPFQGRIVAATHRDLPKMIEEQRFREDLYYRLSVLTVSLPPLKERGEEDFKEIARSLCQRHFVSGIREDLWPALLAHEWPGNIRELNNWIERAAILGEVNDEQQIDAQPPGGRFESALLAGRSPNASLQQIVSEELRVLNSKKKSELGDIKSMRAKLLAQADSEWIEQALLKANGNVSQAAKILNIDRKNLSLRMKELGIDKKAA